MYAIIVNNDNELLSVATQKGYPVYKLEKTNEIDTSSIETAQVINRPSPKNINDFLLSLGIRLHIKGFKYLKYIFENHLSCESGITKTLYPTVAAHFNTTSSRVERAIRHAIETGIEAPGMYDLYLDMFGDFKVHPSNLQFIEGCNIYLEDLSKK